MAIFNPILFSCLKKYGKDQLFRDIISGVIVAIVALPLSIALALASGVTPERGLYTAIVAGFLISFFGGSPVQISGPTAAFATIVASIVTSNGIDGLIIATIIAGLILILLGVCKAGVLIKYIPYTITTGFTAGIAVTIFIDQLKSFFEITYMPGENVVGTISKLSVFFANINTINWQSTMVGMICFLILILWPRISAKIPGSIVAIIIGVVLVKILNLHVNTIGDLYKINNTLPTLSLPKISFSTLQTGLSNGITIAILAAIESLLSAVVADSMIGTKHKSNQELIAQGIGNIGSVLFGGIPATGAIARTAANIKNGGRTPIAGIVHSITLVAILVILMPYVAWIPMPTIAAILFQVAYNMCQWRPFTDIVKHAPKSDIIVLVSTFILTVVFNLVVAIEFGMIIASILFMKNMSHETHISSWSYHNESEDKLHLLTKGIRVLEITGPLFFGAADILSRTNITGVTKVLIIRMRAVTMIDITAFRGLNDLVDLAHKNNVTVILSHINEQPMAMIKKADFIEVIGEENIQPNIDAAIHRAMYLINR